MAFPQVNYCIICEGIRFERGNKLTILGFYGMAPDTDIIVKELGKQIVVQFLLGLGRGSGTFNVLPRILNPDGTLHFGDLSLDMVIEEKSPVTIYTFAFPLIVVQEGQYIFQIITRDQEIYKTSFHIRQGEVAA